jgi:hypothetical protein
MIEGIGSSSGSSAASIVQFSSTSYVSNLDGSRSDSIKKSGHSQSSDTVRADSPELAEAMYILWFSPNNFLIQPYESSGEKKLSSIAAGGATQASQMNWDLASLQFNTQLNQIITTVLTQWGKSVKEQGDLIRAKDKVQDVQNQQLKQQEINEDMVAGRIASDQKTGSIASVMLLASGAVAVGGINPVMFHAVGGVIAVAAPAYSVDLTIIASLCMTGALNSAAVQTMPSALGASNQKIDYEYAKNYSKDILALVNNPDFDNWPTLVLNSKGIVDPAELKSISGTLKMAILSTSLAFLYYMETSYKGKGGGISGQEFVDLVTGKMPLNPGDPKEKLVAQISGLLDAQTPGDRYNVLAATSFWIDNSDKGLDLLKVSPLLELMKLDHNVAVTPLVA